MGRGAAVIDDRFDGRTAVHAQRHRLESAVFAPSMAIPRLGHRRAPRLATKLVVVFAQFAVVFGFAVAGTIFLGLTIASPIVVPLAERQDVALSAMDLATAGKLGSMWWLFAAGMVFNFAAALTTLGNVMQRLAAPPKD
jgi:hypothetical protein